MAIVFPPSPSQDQEYIASNNVLYTWDGNKWVSNLANNQTGPANPGTTPPANPVNGQLWWDTVSGNLFVYYVEDFSSGDSWWMPASVLTNSVTTTSGATYSTQASSASGQIITDVALELEGYPTYDGTILTDHPITLALGQSIAGDQGDAAVTIVSFPVTVSIKTAVHPQFGNGSANGYLLNGAQGPVITLTEGKIYRFDQSHATNTGHPLKFYTTAEKTLLMEIGVTYVGTPGTSGAYTEIDITNKNPGTFYYQCANHAYMGGKVTTQYT
jgi:hypothetical protein